MGGIRGGVLAGCYQYVFTIICYRVGQTDGLHVSSCLCQDKYLTCMNDTECCALGTGTMVQIDIGTATWALCDSLLLTTSCTGKSTVRHIAAEWVTL